MLSLNVRGIRTYEKRCTVLNWCKDQKADIYFFQETYSTKEIENLWRKQAKGKLFFSHGTNHSKGVMILLSNSLDFEIKNELIDADGRFIILDVMIHKTLPFF